MVDSEKRETSPCLAGEGVDGKEDQKGSREASPVGCNLDIQEGNFCKHNSCVDAALREIYCSNLSGGVLASMDRYIYICGFLANARRGAADTHTKKGTRSYTLKCICMKREHDVLICKDECDFMIPASMRKLHDSNRECTIPMSCFLLCQHDAPQYSRLPDMGRHISALLQKHHVQHMASKVILMHASLSNTGKMYKGEPLQCIFCAFDARKTTSAKKCRRRDGKAVLLMEALQVSRM